MRKAQFFSADAILALVFFALILTSFFTMHSYLNQNIKTQETRNDMTVISAFVSSLLVQTEGSPDNWQTMDDDDITKESVSALGLSSNADGWNLDQDKVDKLIALNSSYDALKDILGIKGAGYEFYLNISTDAADYTLGVYPASGAENIVNVERYALLEGSRARVNLRVWNNE